jgi:hypothetical protein
MTIALVLEVLVLLFIECFPRATIRIADSVCEWWWAAVLALIGAQALFAITDSVLSLVETF